MILFVRGFITFYNHYLEKHKLKLVEALSSRYHIIEHLEAIFSLIDPT